MCAAIIVKQLYYLSLVLTYLVYLQRTAGRSSYIYDTMVHLQLCSMLYLCYCNIHQFSNILLMLFELRGGAGGGGGGGGIRSRFTRKENSLSSFTRKINPFHVSPRKTHANTAMTCLKRMLIKPPLHIPE